MLKLNQITRDSFVIYKNLLNDCIRQAKIIFYMKKSISANNDVKETWKFINEVLKNNKRDEVRTVDYYITGTSLTGYKMVNYLNKYFVNAISTIISNTPQRHLQELLNNIPYVNNTFYFIPFSPSEIQRNIIRLKDKPCCISNIFVKVINSVCIPLSYILCYVFNI